MIYRFSQQKRDLGISASSLENHRILNRVVKEAASALDSPGLSFRHYWGRAEPTYRVLPMVADRAFPPCNVTSMRKVLSADIVNHPRLQTGECPIVSCPRSRSLPSGAVPWCPLSAARSTASPLGPGGTAVWWAWPRAQEGLTVPITSETSPSVDGEKTSRTLRGTVHVTPLDAPVREGDMESTHIPAEAGGWRETPTGWPSLPCKGGPRRGAAGTEPPSACPASSDRCRVQAGDHGASAGHHRAHRQREQGALDVLLPTLLGAPLARP